jgi:hypothetical protein
LEDKQTFLDRASSMSMTNNSDDTVAVMQNLEFQLSPRASRLLMLPLLVLLRL